MTALDEFGLHLRGFPTAPFLFVGAGISRRYLGTPTWNALLERVASTSDRPYAFFRTSGNGDYPRIATAIADDLHDRWWSDPAFEASRSAAGNQLSTREGPFKVEVVKAIEESSHGLPDDGPLADEIALLREATIEGFITTNYDELLEEMFPDFVPYVGQNELLFAQSLGIGEIYKIHGSVRKPESLVITDADYNAYSERNPYLAAKLLTIFVEHPVVFLGYSMSDYHIRQVLVAISRVLTTAHLSKLQDRLIFVEWDPDITSPTMVRSVLAVDGFSIPVISVRVAEYKGLFSQIATIRRKFPTKLLRQLKDHVYELVHTNDPNGRLYVQDLESQADIDGSDVVIGVGLHQVLAHHGYVGLTRRDLLEDIVRPASVFNALRIVGEALPPILRLPGNVPVFRYLSEAGYLDERGNISDGAVIDRILEARARRGLEPLLPPSQARPRAERLLDSVDGRIQRLFEELPLADALLSAPMVDAANLDLEVLRVLLEQTSDSFTSEPPLPTLWAKLVCFYDYMKFGPGSGSVSEGEAG